MHQDSFVRLENLSKSYQEGEHMRVVLRDVNATFGKGEFVAILGRSGTGKSTLLNLISGIDRADGGAVWLNGQDLMALDERERTLFRRHNIGFVFQFFNLIPTLTVWENAVLPLELKSVTAEEVHRRAGSLLDAVGLFDRRESFPDRLSGGEETGQQVLALLDRLTRQAGKNLILVTHSAEGAAYADRILHLRDGQLVGA
jgi:putative ABC transport system ATP-binding protein